MLKMILALLQLAANPVLMATIVKISLPSILTLQLVLITILCNVVQATTRSHLTSIARHVLRVTIVLMQQTHYLQNAKLVNTHRKEDPAVRLVQVITIHSKVKSTVHQCPKATNSDRLKTVSIFAHKEHTVAGVK